MSRRQKKERKPTIGETKVLQMIARSRLTKTHLPTHIDPLWQIDGICEVPHKTAMTLIRNGWVIPQRDGLSMFDESQTYVALKP